MSKDDIKNLIAKEIEDCRWKIDYHKKRVNEGTKRLQTLEKLQITIKETK